MKCKRKVQLANKFKKYKKILLNVLGKGDDIASAVNFLSSDESKYITAQTINVSGGIVF